MMDQHDKPLGPAIIDRLVRQIVAGHIVRDAEYVGRDGNKITMRAFSRRREYLVTIEAVQ